MDLFSLYRRFLLIACTVYATVRLLQGIQSWRRRLSGTRKRERVVREYVFTMLWSIRVGRFWRELGQIAALAALLAVVLYAHRYVLE